VCMKDVQKLLGKLNYLRFLYLTWQGGWSLCYHWFGSNTKKSLLGGQVVADFIVDHAIEVDNPVSFVQLSLWGLYFDCSVCSKGQGARCVIVSPSGMIIELSIRLEFAYTNNQVEYESLLHGLENLRDLGARNVDVFGDSNLVMQQIWIFNA
jgi:hypothetical protein